MNEKVEEPIYCMTIELEKGKPEQINIYQDSNGNELAFAFCKEHDLDFSAFDYLKNQIDELLAQFKEKNSNGAEGDQCHLIEELEDENLITEENKKTEENKNKSLSEQSDAGSYNQNNIINEEPIRETKQSKSDDEFVHNDNCLNILKNKKKDKGPELIFKKENKQLNNIREDFDSSLSQNEMEKEDRSDEEYDDITPKKKSDVKQQPGKFALINKHKLKQDRFGNPKGNNKFHNDNKELSNSFDGNLSSEGSHQLNSFIEAPLSTSNQRCISGSSESKLKNKHGNFSLNSNYQKHCPSNASQSTPRNNFEQGKLSQEKPISKTKFKKKPNSKKVTHPNNYRTLLSKISPKVAEGDKDSSHLKDQSTYYYSELGFIKRMEYYMLLYKQRKNARQMFTQSAHDETGQILFKPKLIAKHHDITYSKEQDRDKDRDVFTKNYEYAFEYRKNKEKLYKKFNDTISETRSHSKKKNEIIISNLHTEVFTQLFNELDSDQDDLITYISINTKNTNQEVMRIIMPLITELKEDKQMLKRNEFLLAMQQLYLRLPKKDRELLISEMKKKCHKKNPNDNSKNNPPSKNRNTKILAKKHDRTLEQTYSKFIPLIKKRISLNRNNYFKQKRFPIFEQTSFSGKQK